ncbi:MAG: hypothetical protein GY801_50755 [bacterium]|nr:hypothetical protein [bacterium]
MINISWEQLKKNSESKELSFESFNFQIAYKKFSQFGSFIYPYNTPGTEFYLTLSKDCEELNAKAGEVAGWQAKFWRNRADESNSPLTTKHREGLVEGLKTSLSYQNNLTTWIICTPGQFSNTKTRRPDPPIDELLKELKKVKPGLTVDFWNKPRYEAFYFENPLEFSHIFAHYFSQKFIGFDLLHDYSSKTLRRLIEKFDTDVYTTGEFDQDIYAVIHVEQLLHEASHAFDRLEQTVHRSKEHGTVSEFCFYDSSYLEHVQHLLHTVIGLSQKIIEVFQSIPERSKDMSLCVSILHTIRNQEQSIAELIKKVNDTSQYKKKPEGDCSGKQRFEEREYHDNVIDSIRSLLEEIRNIQGTSERILIRNISIFSEAAHGKTNFVCALCQKLLDEKKPVLFMLGADLRSSSFIRKQILEKLSLEMSMDFMEFLGALNTLGFLRRMKIPIIIDGLNETTPTASVWSQELSDLMYDIRKFDYLLLLTTCRDTYVEQVFINKASYHEVENSIHLDGFVDANIDVAIEKYLDKYDMSLAHSDYDKTLFQGNPLLLKIFCKINRGKKNVTVDPLNIYQSFESYLHQIIDHVSTKDNRVEPRVRGNIARRIALFGKTLWERNSRGINYLNEFFDIFDPNSESGTYSEKILAEGLFVRREIVEGTECVELTYDLLGGFCIARAVLFENLDEHDILEKLSSEDVFHKLFDTDEPQHNHPLKDDILQAMFYLLRRHTGKDLYEVLHNDTITEYSIKMLDLVTSTDEDRAKFTRFLNTLAPNDPHLPLLFENICEQVFLRKDYANVPLLADTLLRMSAPQIDTLWNEHIRKDSLRILSFLKQLIDRLESGQYPDSRHILNQITFIGLFLSSTNKLLRNIATKALVRIGIHYPRELWNVFRKLQDIDDWFIVERLLAALCGVLLQIEEKRLVLEIAEQLEDTFFRHLRTTHVLILDYAETILEYAASRYEYKRTIERIDPKQLQEWQLDEECMNEIRDDDYAELIGYGPIHGDFAKYVIGYGLVYGDSKEASSVKKGVSAIFWRMKQLGYSEELFEHLDKEIRENVSRSYNVDESGYVERYGKKYAWIAFFESYGYSILRDPDEPEDDTDFRTSHVNLDPTFPQKPLKIQLITECFLPDAQEDIQAWITQERDNYLESYYHIQSSALFMDDRHEWVLLYASLEQQGDEGARMYVEVNTRLIRNECVDLFMESYPPQDFYFRDTPEHPYLFAGEIPWGQNIKREADIIEIHGKDVEIYFPFLFYFWEPTRSQINDIGYIPFVSPSIAKEFRLQYNVRDVSYYTSKGEIATKFLWDDYSRYLYIRKDVLVKFMEKHNLSLIWLERGSRYGNYGKMKTTLKPSLKDFSSAKIL